MNIFLINLIAAYNDDDKNNDENNENNNENKDIQTIVPESKSMNFLRLIIFLLAYRAFTN